MTDIRGTIKGATLPTFRGVTQEHGIDRGRLLAEWGRYEEALNVLDTCLELQPGLDNARYNRGNVLMQMGLYERALEDFSAVVDYRSDSGNASAHREDAIYCRGLCNLALGRLREGFAEYDTKPRRAGETPPGAVYDGSQPLEGKTLFVVGEEQLTDNLLLSRYLLNLPASVITLAVPPDQQLLFSFLPGVRLAVNAIGHYDYWCNLLDIVRIGTSFDAVDRIPPRFNLPLGQIARWRPDMPLSNAKKIGLCWSNADGGLPLWSLAPLLEVSGIEIFSLQKDVKPEDKDAFDCLDIWAMGQKFKHVVDLACAIKSMDVVVTIDGIVAHMSATLGVPTWIMLPRRRVHWLWNANDGNSWYPSVRLFRQRDDNGHSVVNDVAASLVDLCRQ